MLVHKMIREYWFCTNIIYKYTLITLYANWFNSWILDVCRLRFYHPPWKNLIKRETLLYRCCLIQTRITQSVRPDSTLHIFSSLSLSPYPFSYKCNSVVEEHMPSIYAWCFCWVSFKGNSYSQKKKKQRQGIKMKWNLWKLKMGMGYANSR